MDNKDLLSEEEKIADIDLYNERMAESMKEKLFFLDRLITSDIDTIVDFGCADGVLFEYTPGDWRRVGVDNSDEMIALAKDKFPEADFVHSLDEVPNVVDFNKEKTLLNLSSVIHEVYSYAKDPQEIKDFWRGVFNSGYNYITIRDMMVSNSTERPLTQEEQELVDDLHVSNEYYDKYLEATERADNFKEQLLHFLMKYRYTENWDREVIENYFPLTEEEFLHLIPDTYEVVYIDHHILPWLKDSVRADLDYDIVDNTHIKVILKKKK